MQASLKTAERRAQTAHLQRSRRLTLRGEAATVSLPASGDVVLEIDTTTTDNKHVPSTY